jgi:hypothetical protein
LGRITDKPQEHIDKILYELRRLKQSRLDPSFSERRELDEDILKEIYDKRVSQLLCKDENRQHIREIFNGFNFDLVIAQPREILIILLMDEHAKGEFTNYLLRKQNLTSRGIFLILTYLAQTNFESKEVLQLLGASSQMKPIIEAFTSPTIPLDKPGYFSLDMLQVLKLKDVSNVLDQIRLRIQAEQLEDYSVALNHLVNEIQGLCYHIDVQPQSVNTTHQATAKHKDYDAKSVEKFLRQHKIPHESAISMRNLFDRRNKNPVSHADPIAWPVSQEEYLSYREHVGICLSHIL